MFQIKTFFNLQLFGRLLLPYWPTYT